MSCPNVRDVARAADIIITMVPDTPNVDDALFGPEGAAEGLSPGKIRCRHEQHLADRDQGVCQADQ